MGTTAELNMCRQGRVEDEDDGALVARFLAGEQAAFDRLVVAHQRRVARLVYRLLGRPGEVDDVVQEVFLSVFENLRQFRGESRFATWLTRIVVSKCRSHQRWRLRRWRLWLAACRAAVVGRASSLSTDHSAPATDAVCEAVDRLPPKYREAVVLRYFEDLPAPAIGEALGISAGAVEVRLTRARAKLKQMLAGKFGEASP